MVTLNDLKKKMPKLWDVIVTLHQSHSKVAYQLITLYRDLAMSRNLFLEDVLVMAKLHARWDDAKHAVKAIDLVKKFAWTSLNRAGHKTFGGNAHRGEKHNEHPSK